VNVEVLGLGPPQHGDGSLGGKSCKRNPAALIFARSVTTSTRLSASPGVLAATVHVIPGLPRTDIMAAEGEVRRGAEVIPVVATCPRAFGASVTGPPLGVGE
jgi:hypothetical protein